MNLLQTLPVAIRALLRNKTRSFLTTLGVVIGVASVISMVAIGEGAKAGVEKVFSSMGTNLLMVMSGSTTSGGVMGGFGSMPTLTWDDLTAIRTELPSVRTAAPQLNTRASVVGEEANWSTQITGTTPDYFGVRSWTLRTGSLLTESDIETGNKVIVLGQTVADKLFGPNVDVIGQTVRIRAIPFIVVGVLAPKGQSPMGQDYDDAAFIPVSTFQAKIQGGLQKFIAGIIVVSAVSPADTGRAQRAIAGLLRDRHHLSASGEDDFSIRNLAEIAAAQQQGTQTLTSLLAAIAIVSLLVGGIGIMNIMLVSVTERTREIGVRMAVGAKPWHILAQFLVEAVSLSMMGGAVGVAVGTAVASALAQRLGWTLVLRPDIAIVAVGFSAFVGVAFGLYPAQKASQLDPIRRVEVRVMLGVLGFVTVILAQVGPPPGTVLTLAAAERQALAHQPQLAQAQAQTEAAYGRADASHAPLLPQVTGTANYTLRRGTLQTGAQPGAPIASSATYGSVNFGISATQLVYDFGQTHGAYRAAKANAEAQKLSEESVRQGVLFGVRSAYLLAWGTRALVGVAREDLVNQDRHLAQVQGQVTVGTRPEIDLAQVRADRASAQLTLIKAETAYETAKAQLNQAMGVEGSTAYDVSTERIAEVAEEGMDDERVSAIGVAQRPELKSLAKQSEADERQLAAVKGAYGPSLGVSTGFTEGGSDWAAMRWNWNAQAQLTWPIFQGGVTDARVREATANQAITRSQAVLERQQIRLDVVQARLTVRASITGLSTAKEIDTNARERLRLAEARYQAGAGSIIELQDAQVAATTAAGQVVQADYTLSLARAQLLKAIGRR